MTDQALYVASVQEQDAVLRKDQSSTFQKVQNVIDGNAQIVTKLCTGDFSVENSVRGAVHCIAFPDVPREGFSVAVRRQSFGACGGALKMQAVGIDTDVLTTVVYQNHEGVLYRKIVFMEKPGSSRIECEIHDKKTLSTGSLSNRKVHFIIDVDLHTIEKVDDCPLQKQGGKRHTGPLQAAWPSSCAS